MDRNPVRRLAGALILLAALVGFGQPRLPAAAAQAGSSGFTTYLPVLFHHDPSYVLAPSWNIQVLVYRGTVFDFVDKNGQPREFRARMSDEEVRLAEELARKFVLEEIPILNSFNMVPTLDFRVLDDSVRGFAPMSCGDYAPTPGDVQFDRNPGADSVIVIWDGSGTDELTSEAIGIEGCAYAWPMGVSQTYGTIPTGFFRQPGTAVFKHEWGHSLTYFYDAAGTAPKPAVNNHINDTDTRYVNCLTGAPYILFDEDPDSPLPNSIYNNVRGFTHDYYSGFTAAADQPTRCLGINRAAWLTGGPVSRPLGTIMPLRSPAGEWGQPAAVDHLEDFTVP